jgi:hypothetical protein
MARLGDLYQLRGVLVALIGILCAVNLLVNPRLVPAYRESVLLKESSWRGKHSRPGQKTRLPSQEDHRATFRADAVIPPVVQGRALQLTSVPDVHRIPETAVSNITAYFSESGAPNIYPQHRPYLFDYNPSLLRIPIQQIPAAYQSHEPPVVYLASVRVSNLNYCFHPEDRQRLVNGTKPEAHDWLGLALLTADFHVVADVVVDLAAILHEAQDFRLFSLPATAESARNEVVGEEQMYISSNDVLLPLLLVRATEDAQDPGIRQVPSVFGSDFAVFVAPMSQALCAPCGRQHSGPCGKNFHFFVSQGQLWAEVWPSAPHIIRSVEAAPCRRQLEPRQSFTSEVAPEVSFQNVEVEARSGASELGADNVPVLRRRAKAPSWLTRGRGSTCCMSVQHPVTRESLWLGISHSKTLGTQGMAPNHYLSTLYAFEDKPPFALVAQSGFFCLPFPPPDDPSDAIPLLNVTRWRILRLGDTENLISHSCPRIHFVSGMTLDAVDPNLVVIAYGINDCTSRLIKVRLEDLMQLLFLGPN